MNILITGGSSDIAKAIAKERAGLGDKIFFTASSANSLKDTTQFYKQADIESKGFVLNFENLKQDSLDKIFKHKIDALILNAATRVPPTRSLHQMRTEKIQAEINANITSNILIIKSALANMMEQEFGRIIFISSMSAEMGTSKYPTYCTVKSAIEGLIKNIAVDYGQINILANILRLGLIKTSRTKKYWSKIEYQKTMGDIIPQGRLGEPIEVAKAINSFLEKEQYINGATLAVSGGLPMKQTKGLLKK